MLARAGDVLHMPDRFAIGIQQAVDDAQENQKIGAQRMGDQGGENVIVAGRLFSPSSAVLTVSFFVDDWNRIEFMNGGDGISQIEKPRSGHRHHRASENSGRRADREMGECGCPDIHKPALANGGDGLEHGQIGGALGEFEFAHSAANGAGADDGDTDSAVAGSPLSRAATSFTNAASSRPSLLLSNCVPSLIRRH